MSLYKAYLFIGLSFLLNWERGLLQLMHPLFPVTGV